MKEKILEILYWCVIILAVTLVRYRVSELVHVITGGQFYSFSLP